MRELVITDRDCGQRIDKYLAKYLDKAPKSFIYKMMRKKNITLNQGKCDGSEHLQEGDCIRMYFAEETFSVFCGENQTDGMAVCKAAHKGKSQSEAADNLQVIYEDKHVLFLNKRAGELSQKAKENDISLVEQLLVHAKNRGLVTPETLKTCRPSVCNRLDRNTSGLVTAGLSLSGLAFLSGQLKTREVKKYYLCLVKGKIDSPSHLKGYLAKDEEKNQVRIAASIEGLPRSMQKDAQWIETSFIPLACSGTDRKKETEAATLLKVHLITGRSHQIRAHLASVGHPVIGDPKYGDPALNRFYRQRCGTDRQLLHAYSMEFGAIEGTFSYLSQKCFTAPLPDDFRRALKQSGIERPDIQ